MRGPFLVKEGGRGKLSGMVVPLLRDGPDEEPDQEPVVPLSRDGADDESDQEPVVELKSFKSGEQDVSVGWRGYGFIANKGDRIIVKRGSVMFILIQAKEKGADQEDAGEGDES